LGENGINSGTVTVSGAGSKFVSDYARVGDYGSTGILNIGTGKASGGLVAIKSIACAINQSTSKAIFNLNGGTLQMGTMQKYSGSVDFNWSDGTIQNYDTATNLTISGTNNLILKLAATGTHAFNLDAGRTGTISAVLSDATSGGTLTKTGLGILTLTATNTYSGDTYLEAGTLSISNRYLNDWASVHIASGAKFDLNYSGIDTVNSLYLDGLPMVSGTWGSSLSNATHIDNLHFSGTGKLNVTNVPEPSTMALLLTATLGGLLWWRRRR
jgi:autotransporter-associated beta strand protein